MFHGLGKVSVIQAFISDEHFNVLLRTVATIHRLNNGWHGETSISWTSPPFNPYSILKRIVSPVNTIFPTVR